MPVAGAVQAHNQSLIKLECRKATSNFMGWEKMFQEEGSSYPLSGKYKGRNAQSIAVKRW